MSTNEHTRTIRVLHVFYGLIHGGIEVWLMNLLRRKPNDFQFDFLVTSQGEFDDEARSLGATIHYVVKKRKIFRYLADFRQVLETNHYDVVHVHSDEFTGHMMKIAAQCGVPVRITHSHNTVLARGRKIPFQFLRNVHFKTINRYLLLKYATNVLACSCCAGEFMMGSKAWNSNAKCRTIYCGVPLEKFIVHRTEEARERLCDLYGIPRQHKVIGHVGSLTPQKNQDWMIRIFHEFRQKHDNWSLLIIGDGELRPLLKATIHELGLETSVFLPGVSDDVPNIMANLFDVFFLPSIFEGFGVVIPEAAAAGLCTICSDIIVPEIIECLTTKKIYTLPLIAPHSEWMKAVEAAMVHKTTPQEGFDFVKQTPFSLDNSLKSLLEVYEASLT